MVTQIPSLFSLLLPRCLLEPQLCPLHRGYHGNSNLPERAYEFNKQMQRRAQLGFWCTVRAQEMGSFSALRSREAPWMCLLRVG